MTQQVTTLYDVMAHSLHLADADWRELLTLAVEHGWEPRGTDAPPPPIGLAKPSWDGRYDDAAGQLVRVDDARHLGDALRRAIVKGAADMNRFREVLPALISWTASRGFIICREQLDEAASLMTADQLSSLSFALSSFDAGKLVPVYSEAAGEPGVRASLNLVR